MTTTPAPASTQEETTTRDTPATPGGDYARTAQGKGFARSLRQHPLVAIAAVLFVVVVALMVWGSQPEDETRLSPGNDRGNGAKAAAQILDDQGVSIDHINALGAAHVEDPSSTTLAIANPDALERYQVEAIMDYPGDIVFLGASRAVAQLAELGTNEIDTYVEASQADAACNDPDAMAAGTVEVQGSAVSGASGPDVEVCFTTADGASAYLVTEVDGRTVRVLASDQLAMNDYLDQYGHAALTLRALGHHPTLVWYAADGADGSVPPFSDVDSPVPPEDPNVTAGVLPSWVGPALFMLALTVVMAGVWRGRRFGRLVPEPLPVVVPGAEAVRGRARLYRSSGDTAHAGAALRAQAAVRIGRRLGIPRSAGPDAIIDATHRATGRSRQNVASLLAGPLPTSSPDMMALIAELDSLEREVHRP
ncbi:DUF4350 domain-containing protein [Demequina globuliformis]|uniref:DUF4350 domain-containing protein n=1 Tax=Demequina globuliformis TaxID=676202 RepID=UPI000780C958|nr:DUF4350 domain-containing protein [Demequina globuliformis]